MLRGKLEKSLADTRLKQAASGHQVEWLGHKIDVDATIRQHMLAAEGLQSDLSQMDSLQDRIEAFDKIFMALEEAKTSIRDVITKHLQKNAGGDETLIASLQLVRNKVQAASINSRRERDLLLVEQLQAKLFAVSAAGDRQHQPSRKAVRAEDVVKMFETLLNGNEELAAIPGLQVCVCVRARMRVTVSHC